MPEVEGLILNGHIQSQTQFPGEQKLVTRISLDNQQGAMVHFTDGHLNIHLPKSILGDWHLDEQVSHEWNLPLSGSDDFYLLVEKDFKCLTERPKEDESSLFPNPNESHG